MTDFADRWRAREDAKISRCTCGAWVYGENDCRACGKPAVEGESPVSAA